MENLNDIKIYGTLKSGTSKGIIAKAEEISIAVNKNINENEYEKLSDFVKQNVQFKSGEYITNYISFENGTPAVFIATSDFGRFKKGFTYYYSGIKDTVEILVSGGGGTGGSSSLIPILNVHTEIKEEYQSSDEIVLIYDWAAIGSNTGYGRVYGYIDNVQVLSRREKPNNGSTPYVWNIGKLSRGKHNLRLSVVDSGGNSSAVFTTILNVGGFEITSNFDFNKYYRKGEDISVPYEIFNNTDLNTKLEINLNDVNIESSSDIIINADNFIIPNGLLNIGFNKLSFKAILEDNSKKSNTLEYTIIIAEEGSLYIYPISNVNLTIPLNQQLNTSINIIEIGEYKYDVKYYLINTELNQEIYSTTTSSGILNTTLIFKSTEGFAEGLYTLKVEVTNNSTTTVATLDFNLTITSASLLSINAINDESLLVYLTAKNKNNESDRLYWKNEVNGENIAELHDFNFMTNGWDNNALQLNSRSYVKLNLDPFKDNIPNGLTVDIEFSTKDICNPEARVLSCFKEDIGFYINTNTACLSWLNTTEEVKDPITGETISIIPTVYPHFIEDEKTRITFVISKDTPNMLQTYVNGVMNKVQFIDSSASFNINENIYLGCSPYIENIDGVDKTQLENFGTSKIYNLRVYNRALSAKEIVTNYVSDIDDPELQDNLIRANRLLDIDDTTLILPEMTFTMFESDYKNVTKDDKQPGIVTYISNNPNLNNIDDFGLIQWQGTSTLQYAVKNFRVTFYDPNNFDKVNEIHESANNKIELLYNGLSKLGKKKKYDIGNGIKESRFTLKADYMDSSMSHNTATAMFAGDLGTEETPVQKYIPDARTCIYGFPIRLYLVLVPDSQKTQDGLPNPEGCKRELIGIFNFNLDKGANDSLGLYTKQDVISELDENQVEDFNTNYPEFDSFSFEISANSDNTAGAFAENTFDSIISDFEYRFPDEDDVSSTKYYGEFNIDDHSITLKITNLYEIIDDVVEPRNVVSNPLISGTYTFNVDGYYKSSNCQWYIIEDGSSYKIVNYPSKIKSTDENGNTIVTTKNSELKLTVIDENHFIATTTDEQEYLNGYLHLQRLITWVKEADDDVFKNEFDYHFNKSAVLDYYLLVLCNGMVDNLGKNMMLDTYGPNNVTLSQEYIDKYDNYIWYPHFYDLDTQLGLDNSGYMRFDTDIEIEQGIFNTSGSLLWTKFARCFADDIKDKYVELRKNKFTIENFMKYYYENQIELIPAMDYNDNFYSKYLADDTRRKYIHMLHGRQYEDMYKFISERLYFLDTYFEVGDEYNKNCTVRVEYQDFDKSDVEFNIKTYIPSYVKIKFNNNIDGTLRKKISRNSTVKFSKRIGTATDQEILISTAPNLKEIGDISKYTPKTVLIENATKLNKLIVNSPNLISLSINADNNKNEYLTELNVDNSWNLTSLDLSKCSNLEYASLKNTSISSLSLPIGAPLKELYLPDASAILNMKDLVILEKLEINNPGKLRTINIQNCPKITGYSIDDNVVKGSFTRNILEKYEPTSSLTTINADVYGDIYNDKFLNASARLAKSNPNNFNIGGIIDYKSEVIPTEYANFKYLGDVVVKYDNVKNISNMFANYKNIDLVWSRIERITNNSGIEEVKTVYYWTDLKEGEFPSEAYREYDGKIGRLLEYYNEDDMLALADKIRDLLEPFRKAKAKFTNVSNLFSGMTILEYLHDDTFDGIDLSEANTTNMFANCYTLKFVKLPSSIKNLNYNMFKNCNEAIVYVENENPNVNYDVYTNDIYTTGCHPLFLFKSNFNSNINADVRTNVEYLTSTTENEIVYKYFSTNEGNILYKVEGNIDKLEIFNISSTDKWLNPLNLIEILPGALINCKNIKQIALPSYNSSIELTTYEASIVKLFKYGAISDIDISELQFTRIYVLPNKNKSISRYFLRGLKPVDTNSAIYYSNEIQIIEDGAFMDNEYREISAKEGDSNLTYIGESAFEKCYLRYINIPNTVVELGKKAFKNCYFANNLKYSNNLTYVPEECFKNCSSYISGGMSGNITGFSKNIKRIENGAFENSKLKLFTSSKQSLTYSRFVCASEDSLENINYFTNLSYIGDYAFRGIDNVTRLDINESIEYIGKYAFYPIVDTVYEYTNVQTTYICWLGKNYSNLEIGNYALAYRNLNWLVSETNILSYMVFIPQCKKIGTNAVMPYDDLINNHPKLDFILTELSEDIDLSDISKNHLEIIYNFNETIEDDNYLYFITENSSKALLARNKALNTQFTIPSYINDIPVVEILSGALSYFNTNLSFIVFEENSNIERIGTNNFSYNNINDITNFPESVEIIDSGNNFKNTTWFKNLPGDQYIYLNKYLIGFNDNILPEEDIKDIEIIYDNAFANVSITNPNIIPNTVKEINKYAFMNTSISQGEIILPDSLEVINEYGFYNSKINKVSFNNELKHVGENAFANCSSLSEIDFQDGILLSSNSDVLSPVLTNEKNTTIQTIHLASSVGDMFAPNGNEYYDFLKLTNISNLYLGTQGDIIELNPSGEIYYLDSVLSSLGYNYTNISTTRSNFRMPQGDYKSSINIYNIDDANIDNTFILQILLGYKDAANAEIICGQKFASMCRVFGQILNKKQLKITQK